MPIYPPRNQPIRKKEIFERKVFDFVKCFDTGCSQEKLINKAEKVRVAQLNLIKAKLHLLSVYRGEDQGESNSRLIRKLEKDNERWLSMSFLEIKKEVE